MMGAAVAGMTKHKKSCYNGDAMQFSILNGNLVIKMKNFTDDTQVITFIGENKVDDTVRTLTKDFKELKMIPEEVLGKSKSIKSKNYIIEEDLNNDDYILSLEDISGLRGRKFKSKRARVKKFLSKYPHHKVKILDHKDSLTTISKSCDSLKPLTPKGPLPKIANLSLGKLNLSNSFK